MTLVAVPFTAVAVLQLYATLSEKPLPPAADQVVKKLTPIAEQRPLPVKDDKVADLNHNGVVISTAFSKDWSVSSEGRQKVLRHKDNEAICQSVLIPASEYNEMVQDAGSVEEAARAMMSAGMAGAPVKVTRLFQEAGPPMRTGLRMESSLSFAGRTVRQVAMVVWMADGKNAANLNCARVGGDPSNTAMLQEMIRAYKFKLSSN